MAAPDPSLTPASAPANAPAPSKYPPGTVLKCFACLNYIEFDQEWLPACDGKAYHGEAHVWHTECAVERLIHLARSGSTQGFEPIKCCQQTVPESTISAAKDLLFAKDYQKYTKLETEFNTPAELRLYCFGCTNFIPPAQVEEGLGTCSDCGTVTCKNCTRAKHDGPCPGLEHDAQLKELAAKEKWRPCAFCGAFVQHAGGCHHIECNCGKEWCCLCGKAWKTCYCPTGIVNPPAGGFETRRQLLVDEIVHHIAAREEPFADSAISDNMDIQQIIASELNPYDLEPEDLNRNIYEDDAVSWLSLITTFNGPHQQAIWTSVAETAQAQWNRMPPKFRQEVIQRRKLEGRHRALPAEGMDMPATYAEYIAHVHTNRLIINAENYMALLQRIESPRFGQWGPRKLQPQDDHNRLRRQGIVQGEHYVELHGPKVTWSDELSLHVQVSLKIDKWLLTGRALGRTHESPQLTEAHTHAWTPSVMPHDQTRKCHTCAAPMQYSEAVCIKCTTAPICLLCACRVPKTPNETPADFVADIGPTM